MRIRDIKRSKIAVLFVMMVMVMALTSCKKSGSRNGINVPTNFSSMNDRERVDYLMKRVAPDSLARFLVDASLGDLGSVKIDTLVVAQGYAYEKYENQPEEMAIFSSELEHYSSSLDLVRKKRLYEMSGLHDPEGFGYDLGLEYVNNIRERKMSVKEITQEIADLKRSCRKDPDTYKRFVKGFKIALELDRGKGISEDVYQRFMDLGEE